MLTCHLPLILLLLGASLLQGERSIGSALRQIRSLITSPACSLPDAFLTGPRDRPT